MTKRFELKPGAGHTRTFKAPCPAGTNVLGGGHYNNGTFGDLIGAHSYPYDGPDRNSKPNDGWAAQLRSLTRTLKVRIYAICADILPRYLALSYLAVANDVTEQNVHCEPSFLSVIGGGTRGDFGARETKSRPVEEFSDQFWTTAVTNDGSKELEVKSIAICANITVEHVAQTGPIAPMSQSYVIATCPPSAPYVAGGGQSNTRPSSIATAASRPIGPTSAWQAWIDNYDSSEVTLGTRASCVPHL